MIKIKLYEGWNFCGFPFQSPQEISSLFSGTSVIKIKQANSSGTATWGGSSWSGSLTHIRPTEGYYVKTSASPSETFTINVSNKLVSLSRYNSKTLFSAGGLSDNNENQDIDDPGITKDGQDPNIMAFPFDFSIDLTDLFTSSFTTGLCSDGVTPLVREIVSAQGSAIHVGNNVWRGELKSIHPGNGLSIRMNQTLDGGSYGKLFNDELLSPSFLNEPVATAFPSASVKGWIKTDSYSHFYANKMTDIDGGNLYSVDGSDTHKYNPVDDDDYIATFRIKNRRWYMTDKVKLKDYPLYSNSSYGAMGGFFTAQGARAHGHYLDVGGRGQNWSKNFFSPIVPGDEFEIVYVVLWDNSKSKYYRLIPYPILNDGSTGSTEIGLPYIHLQVNKGVNYHYKATDFYKATVAP